ncbi:MAG: hypothetical protein RR444_12070 [Oscillospiraceae bacterium]
MEIQKSFSKTAFGGFKKEEVTQYIDEIITKYDEEVTGLKAEVDSANAQITEFKSIIEDQYKKIVEITASCEAITVENAENINKIADLEVALKPFIDAQTESKAIIESAKKEAYDLTLQIKQQVYDTTEQAKIILGQANEKAKSIVEPAKFEAESVINCAREKAQDIISSAKKQESQLIEQVNRQIEATILLNEENERKASKLLEDSKREAEAIIRRAKAEAESEKNHYDSCIKTLETQKSKLLFSLDEIKGSVQAIQIARLPKSEAESFQALRQSTTEAIRKKFAMLNKERQGGNSRD